MKHLRTLICITDVARSGSVRKSAERLNLTPSALTRKIQAFEEELGTPIFERLAHGMRLNAAGELLVRHLRNQVSDFERVRSQIADLSGVRRGHVAVACSQAFSHAV
ncbi:MAG: LysR family transcriptional regulator, partial [Microvirga sp.]